MTTTTRWKVKIRSHHTVAHLQPLRDVPTKYQLPTPYSFWHIAQPRFYRGQGHYGKVKGQIKVKSLQQGQIKISLSHYDVAHLRPPTNVPTKYQLPTPYGFRDKARTRFSNSRSLWQGQRSNQGHPRRCTLTPPNQCPYQLSTSYTLWFLRFSPDKLFPVIWPSARSSGHHGWKQYPNSP